MVIKLQLRLKRSNIFYLKKSLSLKFYLKSSCKMNYQTGKYEIKTNNEIKELIAENDVIQTLKKMKKKLVGTQRN